MSSLSIIATETYCRIKQKLTLSRRIWKSLTITGLFLLLLYIYFSSHLSNQLSSFITSNSMQNRRNTSSFHLNSPTKINHIVFGIAGYSRSWGDKRWYIESWWRPNVTRGCVFLETTPIQHLPWPPASPPYRVSENISKYDVYFKQESPFFIRILRIINEILEAEREGVRWYVMGDDDTVLFLDNLVEALARYDHSKFYYIGMNSECVISNFANSFDMAFGGAGYALSYPLAKLVAKNMDLCIKRYSPTAYASDQILQSCVADLGVPLTTQRGLHQVINVECPFMVLTILV